MATGAYERPVHGAGLDAARRDDDGRGADAVARATGRLPGRRVAVCGSGPLNLQVALELAEGGAEVAIVAERAAAPIARPLEALALAMAGPKLAGKGVRMLRGLRRGGVPVRHRTELQRVETAGRRCARPSAMRTGRETVVTVDAL